ncbi:3-phosphoshikimate 1-carboxyvinyltransferase [Jeotgalibacillus haloalkalitolerans]|uniref:3-phosphoshikimate 1-carboxyvinyltransferase n=1 Tax=Jeotgalibacillus haloalkalitolerans TaxID=3104292 RepID=A0ABU5KMR8_9BACL|nr:3-phosphoshikimate 1-carboxyvinyltransferase [Jeotgalibacillus sp. HH7-29]MDZ5712005.1 3-phosphoshikimate 1-carboxyvinyltransferase [Jeotgalibacillus sp. HH7-29]
MKMLQFENPSIQGELKVPGDKSISHRSIMFGAISEGVTRVTGFLKGDDCLSTIDCFRKMGINITEKDDEILIEGKGFHGLKEPEEVLYTGNSGTTTRLLLGILAGRPFHSVVTGDESIAKRPMNRVTEPLKQMGASIDGRDNGNLTPLSVRGGKLKSFHYKLPVASAQLKSALILAGLQSEEETIITEPEKTRDHTEKMIRHFGGNIAREGNQIKVSGNQPFKAKDVHVPGDISSAAFFLTAAAITSGSSLVLKDVGLNETRTGILDVLKQMEADFSVNLTNDEEEPQGEIMISTSRLKGCEIAGELIPRLIDEIPIIALLATQATGQTVIKDAEELKVKETNRIDAVVEELKKLGADIHATEDGMIINGPVKLNGGQADSRGDHRIGMMLAVASLITDDAVHIKNHECISVSYPAFFEDLSHVTK